MKLKMTEKQQQFIAAYEDEVLFGGAAGGGKSYGQVIDALLYALQYNGSKQLILRCSFRELEKSIIRTVQEIYPQDVFTYNISSHMGKFTNGSIIDFGYVATEADVHQYQSAEYDVIRFDELTNFTEYVYLYMLSRLRGANNFPKSVKSSTNPGGVGHAFTKKRFISIGEPNKVHATSTGNRLFIPSLVQDNIFLMDKDPGYLLRLDNLPEAERRALKFGDWDVFEGQYFPEFNRGLHVAVPFTVPAYWRVYRVFDYGLDMLACLWIAVDEMGCAWVIKELHIPNLIISDAAEAIKAYSKRKDIDGTEKDMDIYLTLAPPDLWSRSKDSGITTADRFNECGLRLHQCDNARVFGWLNVHEYLKPVMGLDGETTARLKIFNTCYNLIENLPLIQHDDKNPDDCAAEPHEITHVCDALRYFCQHVPVSAKVPDLRSPEERFLAEAKKRALNGSKENRRSRF